MGAWLYILRCNDGSYYTGTTRADLERRVAEHQSGHFPGYTETRRPVELAYSEYFDQITDAIAAERQIKGGSRVKKEALMSGDFAKLKESARRHRSPSLHGSRRGAPRRSSP
ncbi:GIY-YIG nuclease family protein [Pseudolabrys sp. FHR47]|uniref:GIY-YIG nuclease family protein n=1 Tax=Pseudolabrys sp. FHR47 TaxID=2562284 RepID=UPI0010BEA996|nr:GIY-YIG nuclease family protein [Pseudolabrys sp. FHR47]